MGRSRTHRSGVDGPAVGDALQLVLAAVGEGQLAADHEVAHRARDEDLTCIGEAPDAGGEVDTEPRDVIAAALDLAAVEARTDVKLEPVCVGDDLLCAAHTLGRACERGEHTVTGRLDDLAARTTASRRSAGFCHPSRVVRDEPRRGRRNHPVPTARASQDLRVHRPRCLHRLLGDQRDAHHLVGAAGLERLVRDELVVVLAHLAHPEPGGLDSSDVVGLRDRSGDAGCP